MYECRRDITIEFCTTYNPLTLEYFVDDAGYIFIDTRLLVEAGLCEIVPTKTPCDGYHSTEKRRGYGIAIAARPRPDPKTSNTNKGKSLKIRNLYILTLEKKL